MNVDDVLKELAESIGKRKTDLKKTFNSILKKKREEDGLEEILGEDGFNHLGLLGTCKRYDIDPDVLEELMSKPEAEEIEEETEEEIEEVQKVINTEVKIPPKNKIGEMKMSDDWKDVLNSAKDPTVFSGEGEESQFEKLPSFKPLINVKYHVRLANPSKAPNKIERTGDWGPYKTYPTDIVLVKILSDLDKVHEEGKKYVFWMNAAMNDEDMVKEFDHFAKFWMTLGTAPDGRVFEVLKTQAKSKKGRNYNVWRFGEA